VKSLLPLILIFFLASAGLHAQEDLLVWLNRSRLDLGLAELREEGILSRTAREYALALLNSKWLSHRDAAGRTALERYRAQGGTAVRIGEVIGAGASAGAVARAWMESPGHREVILRPEWTHAGWGRAQAGELRVWVILFTRQRVEGLRLRLEAGAYRLEGVLNCGEAGRPVLFSGLRLLEPERRQADTGAFVFLIPLQAGSLYHRLGSLDGEGRFTLACVFYPEKLLTSFPEREPR